MRRAFRALAGVILLAASFPLVTPPASAGGAGPALLRPDFNGDGFDDLAIATPGATVSGNNNAGAVTVLYGGTGGLTSAGAQLWHQGKTGIADDPEGFDSFGTALAAGDFDGDGFADLAVGVPFEDIPGDPTRFDAGIVHLIYGSSNGLRSAGSEILEGGGPDDEFGAALASMDTIFLFSNQDPDGLADLAIGAPGAEGGLGRVEIHLGSADGLAGAPGTMHAGPGPAGSRLGSALAAGDFDGDGVDTLFAGLPFINGGRGGVQELLPDGALITQNTDDVQNTAEEGDLMGASLAAGDFDADGKDDLAIGAPGETLGSTPQEEAGLVTVLYGTGTGLSSRNSDQFLQSPDQVGQTFESNDHFGAALFAINLGRGAAEDLSVGVPDEAVGERAGAGMVHVLYGSPGGLADDTAQAWHQDTPNIADPVEAFDSFGTALGAGRFGKGGKADLAIGIPGEDVGQVASAGAVAVLYSRKNGLSAEGDQFWHADRPGVPGSAEKFAEFGTDLYSSDSPLVVSQ